MGIMGIFFRKISADYAWAILEFSWEIWAIFNHFFHIFNHQNVISKKKESSKFYVNPMPSENDLDDTEI